MKTNDIEFREKQKAEAVKRMQALHIYAPAIQAFQRKGTVMYSERPMGALYELGVDMKKLVDQFEQEYGTLVYTCTHTFFEFGECLEMLYVSRDEDEWELDMEDVTHTEEFEDGVKGKYVIAYVANLDDPICSEIGSIVVAERFGGLLRIY